jgi:uncharacterized protein (TIGR02246 family)
MTPADQTADREAVRSLLRQINDAWRQGRPEELVEYFHPQIVLVHPGFSGRGEGRVACVQSYVDFLAAARVHEYTESDHQIDVWGDTAVATYRFVMAWEMGGQSYREAGHDLFVFSREDGRWLAVWRTLQSAPSSDPVG